MENTPALVLSLPLVNCSRWRTEFFIFFLEMMTAYLTRPRHVAGGHFSVAVNISLNLGRWDSLEGKGFNSSSARFRSGKQRRRRLYRRTQFVVFVLNDRKLAGLF